MSKVPQKLGKIGRSLDVDRRMRDYSILPEEVTEVHRIATDDPAGTEKYWHGHLKERVKRGEWFELTRADVTAFKRWRHR